jgi:hypothetical protein
MFVTKNEGDRRDLWLCKGIDKFAKDVIQSIEKEKLTTTCDTALQYALGLPGGDLCRADTICAFAKGKPFGWDSLGNVCEPGSEDWINVCEVVDVYKQLQRLKEMEQLETVDAKNNSARESGGYVWSCWQHALKIETRVDCAGSSTAGTAAPRVAFENPSIDRWLAAIKSSEKIDDEEIELIERLLQESGARLVHCSRLERMIDAMKLKNCQTVCIKDIFALHGVLFSEETMDIWENGIQTSLSNFCGYLMNAVAPRAVGTDVHQLKRDVPSILWSSLDSMTLCPRVVRSRLEAAMDAIWRRWAHPVLEAERARLKEGVELLRRASEVCDGGVRQGVLPFEPPSLELLVDALEWISGSGRGFVSSDSDLCLIREIRTLLMNSAMGVQAFLLQYAPRVGAIINNVLHSLDWLCAHGSDWHGWHGLVMWVDDETPCLDIDTSGYVNVFDVVPPSYIGVFEGAQRVRCTTISTTLPSSGVCYGGVPIAARAQVRFCALLRQLVDRRLLRLDLIGGGYLRLLCLTDASRHHRGVDKIVLDELQPTGEISGHPFDPKWFDPNSIPADDASHPRQTQTSPPTNPVSAIDLSIVDPAVLWTRFVGCLRNSRLGTVARSMWRVPALMAFADLVTSDSGRPLLRKTEQLPSWIWNCLDTRALDAPVVVSKTEKGDDFTWRRRREQGIRKDRCKAYAELSNLKRHTGKRRRDDEQATLRGIVFELQRAARERHPESKPLSVEKNSEFSIDEEKAYRRRVQSSGFGTEPCEKIACALFVVFIGTTQLGLEKGVRMLQNAARLLPEVTFPYEIVDAVKKIALKFSCDAEVAALDHIAEVYDLLLSEQKNAKMDTNGLVMETDRTKKLKQHVGSARLFLAALRDVMEELAKKPDAVPALENLNQVLDAALAKRQKKMEEKKANAGAKKEAKEAEGAKEETEDANEDEETESASRSAAIGTRQDSDEPMPPPTQESNASVALTLHHSRHPLGHVAYELVTKLGAADCIEKANKFLAQLDVNIRSRSELEALVGRLPVRGTTLERICQTCAVVGEQKDARSGPFSLLCGKCATQYADVSMEHVAEPMDVSIDEQERVSRTNPGVADRVANPSALAARDVVMLYHAYIGADGGSILRCLLNRLVPVPVELPGRFFQPPAKDDALGQLVCKQLDLTTADLPSGSARDVGVKHVLIVPEPLYVETMGLCALPELPSQRDGVGRVELKPVGRLRSVACVMVGAKLSDVRPFTICIQLQEERASRVRIDLVHADTGEPVQFRLSMDDRAMQNAIVGITDAATGAASFELKSNCVTLGARLRCRVQLLDVDSVMLYTEPFEAYTKKKGPFAIK